MPAEVITETYTVRATQWPWWWGLIALGIFSLIALAVLIIVLRASKRGG